MATSENNLFLFLHNHQALSQHPFFKQTNKIRLGNMFFWGFYFSGIIYSLLHGWMNRWNLPFCFLKKSVAFPSANEKRRKDPKKGGERSFKSLRCGTGETPRRPETDVMSIFRFSVVRLRDIMMTHSLRRLAMAIIPPSFFLFSTDLRYIDTTQDDGGKEKIICVNQNSGRYATTTAGAI